MTTARNANPQAEKDRPRRGKSMLMASENVWQPLVFGNNFATGASTHAFVNIKINVIRNRTNAAVGKHHSPRELDQGECAKYEACKRATYSVKIGHRLSNSDQSGAEKVPPEDWTDCTYKLYDKVGRWLVNAISCFRRSRAEAEVMWIYYRCERSLRRDAGEIRFRALATTICFWTFNEKRKPYEPR